MAFAGSEKARFALVRVRLTPVALVRVRLTPGQPAGQPDKQICMCSPLNPKKLKKHPMVNWLVPVDTKLKVKLIPQKRVFAFAFVLI